MLKPSYLDNIPDNLAELYAQIENDIIANMAKRIKNMVFIPAAEWQYKKLIEMGYMHDYIIEKLSELSGIRIKELERLMAEAGAKTIETDSKIYRRAGLNPPVLEASTALKAVLQAGFENTNGLFENITKTTANTSTKQFENALDRAWMQVNSGAFSYNDAIITAVKDLAGNGLASIKYPSGHIDYLDVAVRRAIVTGINQTATRLQTALADEMGCDLVETTAHSGARPSHAAWQGRIFSRSGKHKKYPPFAESTGYGTGDGLAGWNCRHSFFPFIEGVSEPAYTKTELAEMNAKKYEYNGKKLNEYEASQKQRYIERQIRRWKREYAGMEAVGIPVEEAAAKIVRWQSVQRDFLKQTGLKRQFDREQIPGYNRSQAEKVFSVERKAESYKKIIGASTSTGIEIMNLSEHFIIRAVQREIPIEDIHEALQNPLKVGKIKTDSIGQISQEFIGDKAIVQVNPETGNLVTLWKTSYKLRRKLKGGQ